MLISRGKYIIANATCVNHAANINIKVFHITML